MSLGNGWLPNDAAVFGSITYHDEVVNKVAGNLFLLLTRDHKCRMRAAPMSSRWVARYRAVMFHRSASRGERPHEMDPEVI